MTPEELPGPLTQGIPAFGDSIGGMFIAGGIAGALLHREKTGEGVEMDVSLLSAAWWASGAQIAQIMETGISTRNGMPSSGGSLRNPFMGNFHASDGGTINLCMVSPTGLVRDTFAHFGVPEAADVPLLIENTGAASDILVKAIRAKPFDYWREHLKTLKGQWAPIQSFKDLLTDQQAVANDMIIEVEGADGASLFGLCAGLCNMTTSHLKRLARRKRPNIPNWC